MYLKHAYSSPQDTKSNDATAGGELFGGVVCGVLRGGGDRGSRIESRGGIDED